MHDMLAQLREDYDAKELMFSEVRHCLEENRSFLEASLGEVERENRELEGIARGKGEDLGRVEEETRRNSAKIAGLRKMEEEYLQTREEIRYLEGFKS